MRNNSRVLIFCLGLLNAGFVFAGPADYVYTPTVEYGEKEVDFKYGTARQKNGTLVQATNVGYGYGAGEYWFTEFYLKQKRSGNQTENMAEWENLFQLTETGEYPVDFGLVTELEAPLSADLPWEIKLGSLFQTEFGKLQLNGNLMFKRAFGKADKSGEPYVTLFGYQWQAKYRWKPDFEYGLQGFGEMGKWNDWNKQADQFHNAGPAIFGRFVLGKGQAIRYNAAWLLGTNNATPKHTFRMQVEYEY
jgi:hypothetical protein